MGDFQAEICSIFIKKPNKLFHGEVWNTLFVSSISKNLRFLHSLRSVEMTACHSELVEESLGNLKPGQGLEVGNLYEINSRLMKVLQSSCHLHSELRHNLQQAYP